MRFHVRASRELGWIQDRVGVAFSPKARAIAAVDEKTGRIAGMVAYDQMTPNSAQTHIALDNPIALRALMRPAFKYPFEELKLGLLLAFVLSTNLRSLELTEHVGFKPVYRIDDAVAPGVHFVLFEMRRENCRWLEA